MFWRCARPWLVAGLALLAPACGGGSKAPVPDGGGPGDGGAMPAGARAVLRRNVKVLDAMKDQVVSRAAGTWTLKAPLGVVVGDVLLLETDAVKVTAVSTQAGQTVLAVTPAEVSEVFSQLALHGPVTLIGADFTPEPTMAVGPRRPKGINPGVEPDRGATPVPGPAAVLIEPRVSIPVTAGVFSAQLTFAMAGQLDYAYEEGSGVSGSMSLTPSVEGWEKVASTGMVSAALPEKRLGTIRIPIPVSVFDAVLNNLGIRLASIAIPISVGLEATASYGIAVKVTGSASTSFSASYDDARGFSTMGPSYTGSLGVEGDLPGVGPTAAARFSESVGIYVRAKPQLLILNQVASMGADVKGGLYADGDASVYLTPPYYCLQLQGKAKGEAFAFVRGVGFDEKKTQPIDGAIALGQPLTMGGCGDAGVDGGADAGAGDGATGGSGGAAGGAGGAGGSGGGGAADG